MMWRPPGLAAALERVLEDQVLPNKDLTDQYKYMYNEFMSVFIPLLQRDEKFGRLFERAELAGTPTRRRVRLHNEFDTNVVMRGNPALTIEPACSGYARLRVILVSASDASESLERLLGVSPGSPMRYLMGEKTTDLLYSAVIKAAHHIKQHRDHPHIVVGDVRRLCPVAVTLHVEMYGKEMSLDFSPYFEFGVQELPPALFEPRGALHKYRRQITFFGVVPRPLDQDRMCWRFDFRKLEKQVFVHRGNMKNAIRLITWLLINLDPPSDQQNEEAVPHLSPYIIKNAFYLKNELLGSQYWNQDLGTIVIEMLLYISNHLREGLLEDLWCAGLNLLAEGNPQYWKDLAQQLRRIWLSLQSGASGVIQLFEINKRQPLC